MIESEELHRRAMADVATERESQPPFDDSENTQGLWVAYIANYAGRWAMPLMN